MKKWPINIAFMLLLLFLFWLSFDGPRQERIRDWRGGPGCPLSTAPVDTASDEISISLDAMVRAQDSGIGLQEIDEALGFGEPMEYIFQDTMMEGSYDAATDLLVTYHRHPIHHRYVIEDVRRCDGDCFRRRD